MAEPLPLPRPLTPGVEYQVTNSECLSIKEIVGPDGIVREVKATFTNRAVLRMTLAEPYPDGIDQPPAGEFSAGPFRI